MVLKKAPTGIFVCPNSFVLSSLGLEKQSSFLSMLALSFMGKKVHLVIRFRAPLSSASTEIDDQSSFRKLPGVPINSNYVNLQGVSPLCYFYKVKSFKDSESGKQRFSTA